MNSLLSTKGHVLTYRTADLLIGSFSLDHLSAVNTTPQQHRELPLGQGSPASLEVRSGYVRIG